jgi:transposase
MDATTMAVDLAKDVFEVALANRANRIIDRKRLTRRQFERFVESLPAGIDVVMEACGTAHYWGRRCQARGLAVRLLPVQYVRPYVRRNKTDRTDTEAMLEANRCAGLHAVPVKTVDQQALQALHRVRTQWQATRTGRINVIRGLPREQGHPVPAGARTVMARVIAILDDPACGLPTMLRQTVMHLVEEVHGLEARVATIDRELARVARTHAVAVRLQQVPGVGVVTATAMLGAVAHIHAFVEAAISRAGSGLHRGNPRRGRAGISGESANAGMATYAVSSPTGPVRCSLPRNARRVRRRTGSRVCNSGPSSSTHDADTTRRPLRSPTSSPGSFGPCGATTPIFIRRPCRPRRRKGEVLTQRDAQRG